MTKKSKNNCNNKHILVAMFVVFEMSVTDVFRVGSGDVEWDGRVSEVGQDAEQDLASTYKLRPRCTRCPYLES